MRRALARLGKLAFLALAVWLAVRMLRGLRWAELWGLVRSADAVWLGVVVGALLLRPAAAALRWRAALRRLAEPPGVSWTYGAVSAGLLMDHVTPTARLLSAVFRARWLGRRSDREIGPVLGTVVYEQITHEIVMALATMAALVLVAARLGRDLVAAGLAVAGCLFIAGVIFWARRHGGSIASGIGQFLARRAEGASGRLGDLWRHGGDAVTTAGTLVEDVRLGVVSLAWSLGFLAVNVLAQWAAFRALGVDPGVWMVFAVLSVGLTAGVLAGTPGGAGATEATLVGVYVLLGMEPAAAAGGALLYRGFHYGVVVLLGLGPLVALEVSNPNA